MLTFLLACTLAEPLEPAHELVVEAALLPGGAPMFIAVDEGRVAAISSTPLEATTQLRADIVTPGLIDAHGHPAGLGRSLDELRLSEARSFEEVKTLIAERAEGEGWLTGRGWDQNDWPDHEGFPTAADLDLLVPDRPAALRRVDGHAVWLNTLAMEASGITAHTPSPEGGRILDGVLVDEAMSLLVLPETPVELQRARLEEALEAIRASGLVGVHAMGVGDQTLALYESVELPVKVWVYVSPDSQAAERLKVEGPWGEGRLRVVGVKMFADGALGSRGALLSQDYADEPGHRGLALTDTAALTEWATALLATDAQLAVHAIGDQGVRNTLDAFQAARKAHPDSKRPLRVEHAQVVHPEDLPRFAGLNVVASMQPTHASSDSPWAEARLGPERVQWAYAWRTLLDAGAAMAFGSDFPVEEYSPSYGIEAAIHRDWQADQRLDFATTIGLFSEGAYDALGEQGGTIRVGGPADLTLWRAVERDTGLWFEATSTLVDGEVSSR